MALLTQIRLKAPLNPNQLTVLTMTIDHTIHASQEQYWYMGKLFCAQLTNSSTSDEQSPSCNMTVI